MARTLGLAKSPKVDRKTLGEQIYELVEKPSTVRLISATLNRPIQAVRVSAARSKNLAIKGSTISRAS